MLYINYTPRWLRDIPKRLCISIYCETTTEGIYYGIYLACTTGLYWLNHSCSMAALIGSYTMALTVILRSWQLYQCGLHYYKHLVALLMTLCSVAQH